jgi:hypothetical protein
MPAKVIRGVSGHSTRVGATQDLAALDIDLAAITQAGGWKSTRMPLQYAEKIVASRSGMARSAELQGRNEDLTRQVNVTTMPSTFLIARREPGQGTNVSEGRMSVGDLSQS